MSALDKATPAETETSIEAGTGNRRSDLIGWSLMLILGVALVGVMAYKVNHANERQLVGQQMMRDYMAKHHCVRLAQPVQNQPLLIRCDNGQTTEHLLRKKVIGDSWR